MRGELGDSPMLTYIMLWTHILPLRLLVRYVQVTVPRLWPTQGPGLLRLSGPVHIQVDTTDRSRANSSSYHRRADHSLNRTGTFAVAAEGMCAQTKPPFAMSRPCMPCSPSL
jgi:hypothetical protein